MHQACCAHFAFQLFIFLDFVALLVVATQCTVYYLLLAALYVWQDCMYFVQD